MFCTLIKCKKLCISQTFCFFQYTNSTRIHNQRTNGPVNALLISGPTVSTKTNGIGQCQPKVIIYINFVELESPMLHAKFQDHRTWFWRRFLKVFTIYGHGSHLGHVTCTIYINFLSHFPRRIHKKLGIDWPIGFGEDV